MPQVDVVSRSGERIAVSVWMKRLKQQRSPCCVVVLEPVERVSAWVAFRSDVSHSATRAPPRSASARGVPRGLWAGRGLGVWRVCPAALLVAALGQGIGLPGLCSLTYTRGI